MKWSFLALIVCALFCNSCAKNRDNKNAQNFTLGEVQMKIERGMSQGEVAEALGAPNIVTKEQQGGETWVYDKVGTDITYSEKSGGFWLVVVGAGGSKGKASTSQRTLTAVIRFDDQQRVQNITYHSSKF